LLLLVRSERLPLVVETLATARKQHSLKAMKNSSRFTASESRIPPSASIAPAVCAAT
jgi:hypothetical protein